MIDDDAERVVVFASVPVLTDYWLGASERITDGTFLTITGQPLCVVWTSGEPHAGAWLQLEADGRNGDSDCAARDDYICEIDGCAVDRSTF